jgi:hypothetical protein
MSESVQTETIAKANIVTAGVPRIIAVEGPGKGRSLALTRSLATAGRHATNSTSTIRRSAAFTSSSRGRLAAFASAMQAARTARGSARIA